MLFFGPKEKLKGDWISVHNEELHNAYSSPNINRAIKSRNFFFMVVVCNTYERRDMHRELWTENVEGKRPFGKPRRIWEEILNKLLKQNLKQLHRLNNTIPRGVETLRVG
jgi:hypothetical protein